MKKRIIYWLVIVIATIFQLSFAPVAFSTATPNFVFSLIIAGTVVDGFNGFFWWILAASLFYNLLSFDVVGTYVLIAIFSAYVASFFSKRFAFEIQGFGILLIVFFAAVNTTTVYLFEVFQNLKSLENSKEIIASSMHLSFLWQILLNTILILFWIWILKKIKTYFYLKN